MAQHNNEQYFGKQHSEEHTFSEKNKRRLALLAAAPLMTGISAVIVAELIEDMRQETVATDTITVKADDTAIDAICEGADKLATRHDIDPNEFSCVEAAQLATWEMDTNIVHPGDQFQIKITQNNMEPFQTTGLKAEYIPQE